MENFQLYRTNLILGGQMKWDIVIDSAYSNLYVSDFHLSPISNNIPYTYKKDENILRNTHQDNVKEYFKNMSGYFYDEGIDAQFTNNWPIISKKSELKNVYCNTYDMGCRRINSYKRYNKQFEFFCPVWIEELNDDLSFIISIRSEKSDLVLSKNILKLSVNNIATHDNFVKYFNEYIRSSGIDVGCDDLANINIAKKIGKFSGLNVSSGLFEVISSDSIVNNITLRERPLMEVDSMIVESFKANKLIAKQLFNFNLCFNIQDIISGTVFKLMKGQPLVISVDVMIGDKLLEKKDFYTEYDFIPKHITSNVKVTDKYNVLDYLHDYECIDLIDKNKFCQKICHWSLADNNDYIFNLYNGYSGLNINKINSSNTVITENEHQYKNASNTYIKFADDSLNSTGWINTYKINSWNEFNNYVINPELYKKTNATHISADKKYINNIKYSDLSFIPKDFYIIGLEVNRKTLSIIKSNYNEYIADICDGELYAMLINDMILLISTNSHLLVYSKFQKILEIHKENEFKNISITNLLKTKSTPNNIEILNTKLNESYNSKDGVVTILGEINNDYSIIDYILIIYKMMCNKIDPLFISFSSNLLYTNANSPSKSTTEIEYIKDDGVMDYVIRYDGKIKPTFVDNSGTLYYKDYVSDDRNEGKSNLQNSDYIKYINTGYTPKYPSINYCSIKKLANWNYKELPKSLVTEHNEVVKLFGNTPEYSWFNNGISLILLPELELTHTRLKSIENSETTEEIIRKEISKYYNTTDSNTINYIISKYDINTNWEYLSDTNITDYVYNIKLKLK